MKTAWILILPVLLAATTARAEEPPRGAVPFPVERTTVVRAKGGPVYYIDGPTVIPKRAEITVQLSVTIVGINNASLDVQGGLKVHGTVDHWVRIRNVDFSPTREPKKGFHLDMVDLTNCRFVHGEGEGLTGEFTIENAAMQRDCAFDVRLHDGTLKLMTIDSGIPWTIRAEPPDATADILLQVRSCWAKPLLLVGPCDATFRHTQLKGGLTCRNVTEVIVDGCDVYESLAFHQGPEDVFKKVKLTKCNLFEGCTLTLDREASEDAKKERVKVDKFWFGRHAGPGAATKAAEIAERIFDGEDEAHRRVKAKVASPQKKRHRLVDTGTLRLRVPPVR